MYASPIAAMANWRNQTSRVGHRSFSVPNGGRFSSGGRFNPAAFAFNQLLVMCIGNKLRHKRGVESIA